MNGKVLVMGASGFLGNHVVKALAEQKRDIRIFTRKGSNISTIKHLDFEHVYGDVRDKNTVERAVEGCSVIYYCVVDTRAWTRNTKPLRETNIEGFRNVLEISKTAGVERFIYTSTFMTIGRNPSGIASEKDEFNWWKEAPEYVRVRVEAENMFFEYCQKGLPGVACNIGMTFGVDDVEPTPHGMIFAFAALGKFPFYWDAYFSSVGIKDAADALLLAEKNGRFGERYLITEKLLSIKEIFQIGIDTTGLATRLYLLPMTIMNVSCFLFETFANIRNTETRFSFTNLRLSRLTKDFDNNKALKELQWKPRPVEESMAEEAKWFASDECACKNLSYRDL